MGTASQGHGPQLTLDADFDDALVELALTELLATVLEEALLELLGEALLELLEEALRELLEEALRELLGEALRELLEGDALDDTELFDSDELELND
jgi:hypothetical protein